MKSAAIVATLLASVTVAQPHGHNRHHHAKRDLFTEWETVWETATVIIDDDSTQTLPPSPPATSTGAPIQFFQAESSTSAAPVETPEVPAPAPQPTTTSSVYEAPPAPTTTSTQAAPTQQTTTSPAAPSSSTYVPAPAASTSSASSGSSAGLPVGKTFSGDITYYNAALGACGYPDVGKDDTENIVAIPKGFWDSISTLTSYGINQPAHPLCDKTITITSPSGKKTTATIRDRCDGCVGDAIDVTPHAFLDLFGSLDGGRLECTWEIN
ncbi:uncharacterized protein GGS25DRAFT_523490 [Hypoxylon fragiforme]|uniref:uncharacterized protein n=1 Tax=Hypoxylon fragiforme TaxID=63214 RepID=UPI0020C6D81F|nr:uncharacterized protein GGS25DRAFT_523490 [Hypoxylon fragiforme]KAI2605816.1 hypothetical protein GGS25DRAFT_523490 [Hypoxylon fragiforme]